jgi:hypothetical protein
LPLLQIVAIAAKIILYSARIALLELLGLFSSPLLFFLSDQCKAIQWIKQEKKRKSRAM